MIRIMCVDDHAIVRQGIVAFLASQPDMAVVAEAADGLEAVANFRAVQPDVTLMDLQMRGLNGIDAMTAILAEFPAAKIIVLTTYEGDALAQRALKAGAQGYFLKGLLREELVHSIRAVYQGAKRVQPDVAVRIAERHGDPALTPREVEVLQLIARGHSNKLVAAKLSITEETAKTHVRSILEKLRANDRTHAVYLAVQRGIISPHA